MPRSMAWFIDVVNNCRVAGWCFDGSAPQCPSRLSFFADGQKIGEVVANRERPDLKALKFHPTGRCGFEFIVPDHIDLYQFQHLKIHADDRADPFKVFATRTIPGVIRGTPPRVFFMHIPKTAGTSFNTFAGTIFPNDACAVHLEATDTSEYLRLSREKHYLAGHLPLREIKVHFDLAQFDLYTIIREPYSHLHSHLNWVKAIGKDTETDFFKCHSRETQALALLLNELDFSLENSLQSVVAGICGDLASLFDNHQTRYFLDYRRKKVTAPDVSMARAELAHFKRIGTTEEYQSFLDAFCNAYRVICPQQEEKLNRSQSPRLFDFRDKAVRAILHPLVAYDLILYNIVTDNR